MGMIQVNSIDTKTAKIVQMTESRRAHVPLDVRLVAKIGSSVAVASCLGLLLVLVLVSDEKVSGYAPIIGAFALAKHDLEPAMLVFGLAIVGFAGIAAWLFSLYSSFRVAGPLYRISRDLQLQIEHVAVRPMPIRIGDQLQQEWRDFEASVAALHAQHEELRRALLDVERVLGTDAATTGAAAKSQAIARLKKVEQRVRL